MRTFLGGWDVLLKTIVCLAVLDYVTGVLKGILPEAALIRDRIPWTAEEDRDVYCDRCGLPDSDADRWHDSAPGSGYYILYFATKR